MNLLLRRLRSPDAIALALLAALWWLFFWRLFTPVDADRLMLVDGDFSGQFVAFGAYQYARLAAGEIPLWNPYNNGGLPFAGDTQAAVFYPPRLITIAVSHLYGGWSYNALQMEMAAHVLVYTFFTYAVARRILAGFQAGVIGAFIAAIIAGYGGFMSGYPPLQLALLEAGTWLPAALLGLVEATRHDRLRWLWLVVAGWALGLSWMAGHPQTSWFSTYFLMAYFAYRVYGQRLGWRVFIAGTALLGGTAFGVTAVQFLPAVEYTARSMRVGFSFDAKGNGFPFRDVVQLLFPGVVSVWSPLYVGVCGLVLAGAALARCRRDDLFWGAGALAALVLSFGANTILYPLLYNLLPGLNVFRGQERAAYLVSVCLALLAGSGAAYLASLNANSDAGAIRTLRRCLAALTGFILSVALVVLVAWYADSAAFGYVVEPVFFSAIIASLLLLIIFRWTTPPSQGHWPVLLAALVVFELFSVHSGNSNYQPWPPGHDPLAVPALVSRVQADMENFPFRADGNFHGLYGNYGTLFGVMDIRGISPLFLDGPHAIIQRELPSEVAWELFAVRYVFTGDETIPVASEIVAEDFYRGEAVKLHRLTNPRPFALLMYDYEVLDSDAFARALLADANFDPRRSVILSRQPELEMPEAPPDNAEAVVTEFAPERYSISVTTPENAILSLAQVDYPGWDVSLDGQPVNRIRAYGALVAVEVPAGEHVITVTYNPLSFKVGAVVSLITWAALIASSIVIVFTHRKRYAG